MAKFHNGGAFLNQDFRISRFSKLVNASPYFYIKNFELRFYTPQSSIYHDFCSGSGFGSGLMQLLFRLLIQLLFQNPFRFRLGSWFPASVLALVLESVQALVLALVPASIPTSGSVSVPDPASVPVTAVPVSEN